MGNGKPKTGEMITNRKWNILQTWNRLTLTRGEWGGGQGWKEGEGTSQKTCVNDPWTWTIV